MYDNVIIVSTLNKYTVKAHSPIPYRTVPTTTTIIHDPPQDKKNDTAYLGRNKNKIHKRDGLFDFCTILNCYQTKQTRIRTKKSLYMLLTIIVHSFIHYFSCSKPNASILLLSYLYTYIKTFSQKRRK